MTSRPRTIGAARAACDRPPGSEPRVPGGLLGVGDRAQRRGGLEAAVGGRRAGAALGDGAPSGSPSAQRQVREPPPDGGRPRAPRRCSTSSPGCGPSRASITSSERASAIFGAPAARAVDHASVVGRAARSRRAASSRALAPRMSATRAAAASPWSRPSRNSGTRRRSTSADGAGVLVADGVDTSAQKYGSSGSMRAGERRRRGGRALAPGRRGCRRRRRAVRATSGARPRPSSEAGGAPAAGQRARARSCSAPSVALEAARRAAPRQRASTVSSAMRRRVVSLPPATVRTPSRPRTISCSREVAEGVWRRVASSGRSAAKVDSTSSGAEPQRREGVVGGLEQVVDVLRRARGSRRRGAAGAWPPTGASRCRWCRRWCAAPAGRTKNRRLSRGERSTRARPAVRHRERRRTRGARPGSAAGRCAPSARKLSVNGPVALTTSRARRVDVRRSRGRRARRRVTRPRRRAARARRARGWRPPRPRASASRTFSSTRRASSVWQSKYAMRAAQPVAAQVRGQLVAARGRRGCRLRAGRAPQGQRVVEREADVQRGQARASRRGRPGRGTPAAGTGAARCASGARRSAAPSNTRRIRRARGSAARRGSASTTVEVSPAKSPFSTARPRARAAPRRARCRRR